VHTRREEGHSEGRDLAYSKQAGATRTQGILALTHVIDLVRVHDDHIPHAPIALIPTLSSLLAVSWSLDSEVMRRSRRRDAS
jgi:hypothetical protein